MLEGIGQSKEGAAAGVRSRADLSAFLMQLAADIGAQSYLLFAVLHERERHTGQIISSNWIYDAIELCGLDFITRLAGLATDIGQLPRPIRSDQAPDLPGIVDGETARILCVLDHRELYVLKLAVGRRRYFLVLSSGEPAAIRAEQIGRAQLNCCYVLSSMHAMLAAATVRDPLSDRERECLSWVSEGKTTEEVALILGVSANTINAYVASAIQKLSASNRPMAIATAIRSGII
jgi:DNA-binding CsgD family transcriptional regulator